MRFVEGAVVTLGLALIAPGCGPKVHTTRVAPMAIVVLRAKPEVKLEPIRAKIQIMNRVKFQKNRDRLLRSSHAVLDGVANVLLRTPHIRLVEIGGHTDSRGKARKNRNLSRRRAATVRTYLIKKGVAPDRLVIRGYGESSPVDDNTTLTGRKRNRRVEFTILERGPATERGQSS